MAVPLSKQKSYCPVCNFSQKHIKKEFRFITPELLYLISELFCTVLFRLKIITSGETKISSALPRPEKFLRALIMVRLRISARKNLLLSRRILHTSSKKIRGRLLSYLSHQAELQGSRYIDIPLNRQQLADYLSLDRSALSKELAKMKQDGLLDYHKNSFVLKNV